MSLNSKSSLSLDAARNKAIQNRQGGRREPQGAHCA